MEKIAHVNTISEKLEKLVAEYVGTNKCVCLNSQTACAEMALRVLGIGEGDEVIVPAYTYTASASVIAHVGAKIVMIDTQKDSLEMDYDALEAAINKKTKAIIPVHIQGFPCNMDAICAVAKKHGIAVVEDACQSIGGKYKGEFLGTIGEAGAYSFNYYKVITSGEGGALVTRSRELFERALIYHDSSAVAFFGSQLDGISQPIFGGTEFRVSDITGAILREQLKKLPSIIADLHKNKFALIELLKNKELVAPSHDAEGDCATTLVLRFETSEECKAFAERCESNGLSITIPINTGKHIYTNWTQIMEKRGAIHPAMDPFKMEANKDLQHDYSIDMCPKTLDLLSRSAYIAIDPDWTEEQLNAVAKTVNNSL